MRKDIYSAIDADELQKYLDKGYLIKGIFGDSLKYINEGKEIGCLQRINGNDCNSRFSSDGESYILFKVTGVFEWAALEVEHMDTINGKHLKFKKDVVVVTEADSRIVKIGNTHLGSYDLLEFFEHEDGSPVGELKEVSWIY